MARVNPIIKLKDRPHYYFNKIYSTARNTWFHDLSQYTKCGRRTGSETHAADPHFGCKLLPYRNTHFRPIVIVNGRPMGVVNKNSAIVYRGKRPKSRLLHRGFTCLPAVI